MGSVGFNLTKNVSHKKVLCETRVNDATSQCIHTLQKNVSVILWYLFR